MRVHAAWMASFSLCALTACGGGGGLGNNEASSVVTLTADTAAAAAGEVIRMHREALAQGELDLISGASIAGQWREARALRVRSAQARPMQATALIQPSPLEVSCGASGKMVTTQSYASETADTVGDSIKLQYQSCGSATGGLVDGSMTYTLTRVGAGDFSGSAVWDVGLRIDVDVDRSLGSVKTTDRGQFDLESIRSAASTGVDVLKTTSFTTTTTGGTAARRAILSAYEATTNATPGVQSSTARGTLDSSLIDGIVNFTMLSPVVRDLGLAYEQSGVVELSGGGAAKVQLTILDTSTVQVRTDAEGDGSYESSQDIGWSEFAN